MARAHNKRVFAIAGTIDPTFDASSHLFDAVISAAPAGMAVDAAMRDARLLVASAAERTAREFAQR